MAIINIAGIMSLRGRIGDMCFRTMQNGTIVMCKRPKKSKTPPSAKQLAQRARFGETTRKMHRLLSNPKEKEAMEVLYKQLRRRNESLKAFAYRIINQNMEVRQ